MRKAKYLNKNCALNVELRTEGGVEWEQNLPWSYGVTEHREMSPPNGSYQHFHGNTFPVPSFFNILGSGSVAAERTFGGQRLGVSST